MSSSSKVIVWTDGHTDRQTDRQTDTHNWKHYLPTYTGGNKVKKTDQSTESHNFIDIIYMVIVMWCKSATPWKSNMVYALDMSISLY